VDLEEMRVTTFEAVEALKAETREEKGMGAIILL